MKKSLSIFIMMLMVSVVSLAQGQKWLNLARQGNVNAMYQVALRYKHGFDGLSKNEQKAIYWAEKAGQKGNADAMLLASLTYDDLKAKKFASKKLYWAVKAGEAGKIDGMMHARSSYMLLKNYVTSKSDKIKCVEQQIYWNNRMLEQSDLDDMAREQSERLVEYLNNELEKVKADQ